MLGSKAPVPPFSTPLQQAMIRYTAFGPHASLGDVAFYERMLIDTPPDVRAAVGVALSGMDLWHAVASLTVPTLVIAGAGDRLTPPAHARRIAEALPHPAGLARAARHRPHVPAGAPARGGRGARAAHPRHRTAPVASGDGR